MLEKKIDTYGHYLEFPGITVIAKIGDHHLSFWKTVYDQLTQCTQIQQHYAPLPVDSYHMTTINLSNKEQVGHADWQTFLEKNTLLFQQLDRALSRDTFTPTVCFHSLSISTTIQINLSLPSEQKKMIIDIANEMELDETQIPTTFHMTLAYRYKAIDPVDQVNLQQELNDHLLSHVREIKQFSLQPPQLCTFHDMTSFSPWRGQHPSPILFRNFMQKPLTKKKSMDENQDSHNCAII